MESKSESAIFSLPPEEIVSSPVRPSGFITLVLGALSSVVLLSTALLVLPIITVLLGLYALRPAATGIPVGRRFAMVGILLAVFFTSWAVVGNRVRTQELTQNGERFAAQWLELAGIGEWEAVVELMKSPAARQSPKMPLKAYYANTESRVEELQGFMERPAVARIIDAGEDARWRLAEPPLVYEDRGALCVQLRYLDDNQSTTEGIRIELQRMWDDAAHTAEWKVRDFGLYSAQGS